MVHTNDLAFAFYLQLLECKLVVKLSAHIDKIHSLASASHSLL